MSLTEAQRRALLESDENTGHLGAREQTCAALAQRGLAVRYGRTGGYYLTPEGRRVRDELAGIAVWRRCLIRPSEGPDAVAALTTALFREGALPELAVEVEVVEFTELCRGAPDRAVALIRHALDKAASTGGAARSQVRLLAAVDQLEELFTTEKQPLAREALVRLTGFDPQYDPSGSKAEREKAVRRWKDWIAGHQQ